MKCNKRNESIILSCVAIGFSIVTIILFFVKVTPYSVVDSNTFLSVLVAFIGIAVTLLIGYQVYNAVEIKQELSKIDSLKEEVVKAETELDSQKQEIEKKWKNLKNEMEINRCISLSRAEIAHNPIMAFIKLHEALQFLLSSDNPKEDLGWYKEELCERMAHIDKSDFSLDVPKEVQQLKNNYKNAQEKVKTHENYFIVQVWYEEMMKRFEKFLDGMVKTASEEEAEPYSSRMM